MKRWGLFLIIVMFLSIVPVGTITLANAQGTAYVEKELLLNPTDDSYVYEKYPDSNYGSKTYMWVGYYNGREWAYLKFNISSLPADAEIVSAKLCLYNYKLYGSPKLNVYPVLNDGWSEDSITWNNAPTFEATPLDSIDIQEKYKYHCWNVTDFVISQWSDDKIVSFAIVPGDQYASDSTAFNSKEYQENIPYLEITYKVPVQVAITEVGAPTVIWVNKTSDGLYESQEFRISAHIVNYGTSDIKVKFTVIAPKAKEIINGVATFSFSTNVTIPAGEEVVVTSDPFDFRGENMFDVYPIVVIIQDPSATSPDENVYDEKSLDIPVGYNVQIQEIQSNTKDGDASVYEDILVKTHGVVTFVTNYGFAIQNGTGPWSGIWVYTGSSPQVNLGDYVEVQALVDEYYGFTELNYADTSDETRSITILGTSEVPSPMVLPTANVSQEKWEGVLVEVKNVRVINPDLGYGEWLVDDGSGPVRIDDKFYKYSPEYYRYEYIIGLVWYSYGNFKIEPRGEDDIKPYIPEVRISSVEVQTSVVAGSKVPTKLTVENTGVFEENLTLTVYLHALKPAGTYAGLYIVTDEELLVNETFILASNESKVFEFEWTPLQEGKYSIYAVLQASDGTFYDDRLVMIDVYPEPNTVAYALVLYYNHQYMKYREEFDQLYEQFANMIEALQEYGVNLTPIQRDINTIQSNVEEINSLYQKYESLLGYEARGYYIPVMIPLRKATFLIEDTIKLLKEINPILNSTLSQVKTAYEQQNVTQGAGNITISVPKVVKILIDSGHNQYYNADKMSGLINRIKNELNWTVDVNYGMLTYEKLKDYDILIITNPKKDITDEEAQAIKQWVKEGGGLFILGDWYKYVYYRSLNKITEEFGIKFNDDELMDDEHNIGRPYFPLVGEFNFDHPATKFLNETSELYYNGNTLEVSGNAVWLIRGYESSYAVDQTGKVTKEKGSKPIIVAAVEVGNGRIVASGSSRMLRDKDKYDIDWINQNWPFIKGVLLWLAGEI